MGMKKAIFSGRQSRLPHGHFGFRKDFEYSMLILAEFLTKAVVSQPWGGIVVLSLFIVLEALFVTNYVLWG